MAEGTTVLSSFEALMAFDDDSVADSFLVAAVYARAVRTGRSPQDIVEALFKTVPSGSSWPAFREMLLVALEEAEGSS